MTEASSLAPCSPLQGLETFTNRGITLCERPDFGLLRLQAPGRDQQAGSGLSERLQMPLPGPGEVSVHHGEPVFWAAPGEWLLGVPAAEDFRHAEDIRAQLAGLFAVVSVISDSRVALALSGPEARTVLARGSSVDFNPSVFGVGSCVTTRFAHIPLMLACPAAEGEFLLFADRSHAVWLREWFEAAAVEFGESA